MKQASEKRLREIKVKLKSLANNCYNSELGQILHSLSQDINFVIGNEKQDEPNPSQPIEIKAGVWCNDIPSIKDSIETRDSLVKLGADMGRINPYGNYPAAYILTLAMGWPASGGSVTYCAARHADNYFTTKVSYLDIIAAANAMGG